MWESEYQLVNRDNQKIDAAVKASIIRKPDGTAHRVLGNLRDITALKRQQEGYTRSRALEAVGQLTGGVAHDFNNLLMIIQGNAELLGMSALAEHDAESVELISRAAESAAKLTRRLLTFSGQTRLESRCTDIPPFIETVLPLLRAGLPESIAIKVSIEDNVWQPDTDAISLEQAIVNIAMNAKDAMPNGGEFSIICENHEVTPEMVANNSGLGAGRYVVLSLCDTGSGMPASVQARAFEPYFTTKEFGKGTGLGLSTVYGFATQSGGTATIYSEEGHGTTINIYLPVCKDCEPEPVNAIENSEIEIAPQQKRILVVEDQPEVRAHVVKLLTRLGYDVASASDAIEALALLEGGESFDLLYTDIIMPGGMNGQELSKAAEAIAPGMKVLFTSGYPAAAFEHLGFEDRGGINILRKPYKADQLKQAVARTLTE
jgi:signal transduction histidine kinase/ActR/RegA family two-component response regulator